MITEKWNFQKKTKNQFEIPLVYVSKTPSETPKLAPKNTDSETDF